MRLDELENKEPVYLKIKGRYARAGVSAGKYRVKSMTQLENGFDVGMTAWTDGFMFVPNRTNKDLMFVTRSGQPINPGHAYLLVTGEQPVPPKPAEINEQPNNLQIEVENVGGWTEEGDDDYEQDIQFTEYEVIINGTPVGLMTHDDYYGNLVGTLGNRNVELEDINDSPQEALERYFASRTGQAHLGLLNV